MALPLSVFERENNAYYNSLAMIDADGRLLGVYRKSHIPEGPGYHEKFYFSPGDTGFRVWPTRFGKLGVGVCWDQWFPETARAMALLGADMLFYPTAIGSEPHDPSIDSRDHWQRSMQGHAAANVMPLVASNRIGVEQGEKIRDDILWLVVHRGSHGRDRREADRSSEKVLTATFDLEVIRALPARLGRVSRSSPDFTTCSRSMAATAWQRVGPPLRARLRSAALRGPMACVDFETTGGMPRFDRIIEVASCCSTTA